MNGFQAIYWRILSIYVKIGIIAATLVLLCIYMCHSFSSCHFQSFTQALRRKEMCSPFYSLGNWHSEMLQNSYQWTELMLTHRLSSFPGSDLQVPFLSSMVASVCRVSVMSNCSCTLYKILWVFLYSSASSVY